MSERPSFLLCLQAVAPLIPMFRSSVQVPRFWDRSAWCENHLDNSWSAISHLPLFFALIPLAETARSSLVPAGAMAPPFTGRIKQFALEADGNLLLVVGSVSQGGEGRIFRIDPNSGDRAVVSGPEMGEGPRLMDPEGIVLSTLNTIFVTDIGQAAVIRVDPLSGDRTIISSPFMGGGELPDIPSGLAFNTLDQLLVADRTVIYRVDIDTGDRTVISAPVIGQGEPFLVADDIFVIKN